MFRFVFDCDESSVGKDMFFYESSWPIDFWPASPRGLIGEPKEPPFYPNFMALGAGDLLRRFHALTEEAKKRFKSWEGDMGIPSPFWIPTPEDNGGFSVGFVWKQGNNGTTFIVSPVELPHLGASCE